MHLPIIFILAGQSEWFGRPLAPVRITVPAAVVISLLLIAYWGISKSTKPRSRRRLRRANALVIFSMAWSAVFALSVASMDLSPSRFITAWLAVFGCAVLAVTIAFLDSLNNVRILRREKRRRRLERDRALAAIRSSTH